MDRYLLALEPVPEDSLPSAWFDTDYPELWARLPQSGDEPLQSHIDAVVYLGPEPDRNLVDSIELTSEQRVEMARRSALVGGFPESMHIRFKGRESWFRDHPQELPPRP